MRLSKTLTEYILIESQWNLNRIEAYMEAVETGILIESQWNLNYYERLEKEGEY